VVKKLKCTKKIINIYSFNIVDKNKNIILVALYNNLITNKKMMKCDFKNFDQTLPEWFKVQRYAGFPVTSPISKVQEEKSVKYHKMRSAQGTRQA
jgi:hypothetical protein